MERRNKRNIVIGILCTLLVFMGVGYATLNQVLDINGTARSTNTWSIVIESITEKEKSLEGVVNKKATVGSDRISAEFEAEFTKPGDFIIYEVVVKNEGTLPAKIDNINAELSNENTPQQEKLDAELFDIECDETIVGKALPAGASETFTVTVRYKSDATRLPSGDVHATIQIIAVQDTTGGSGNVPATEEDSSQLYKVDNSGLIVGYNSRSTEAQGTTLIIPKEVNGIPVRAIDKDSFNIQYNIIEYYDNDTGNYKIAIYDEENAAIIEQIIRESQGEYGNGRVWNYYLSSDPNLVVGNSYSTPKYVDIDAYNNSPSDEKNWKQIIKSKIDIDFVDFSQATNLVTIGDYSFANYGITGIDFGNINKLIRIGDCAFEWNRIQGELIIPSSVSEIGYQAFNDNHITQLVMPEGVTTIGREAFSSNWLTSITIPSSVTTIGSSAFRPQIHKQPTLTSIIINRSEADFLADVTVGDAWYDNALSPTITYQAT